MTQNTRRLALSALAAALTAACSSAPRGDGGPSNTESSAAMAGCPGGSSGGSSSGGSSSGGGVDCSTWIVMTDANSCVGHLGENCGWTATNEGQGYTCKDMGSWVGCEPGGACVPTGGGGSSGGGSSSGGGTPPSGGGAAGIAGILSESAFDAMFPNRNPIYTYQGLVQAAQTYSAFATSGGGDGAKREVAAFLANVAHETGSLQYVDEIVKGDYCSPSGSCPCEPGQQYYGRGALQLSWNFNYCEAGPALGVDLRANPNSISTDSRLAWGTGVWFWMTSTGAGSTTPHDAIVAGSFSGTIRAINGSIECNGGNPGEVQDRVQFYQRFCAQLGVDPGSDLGC